MKLLFIAILAVLLVGCELPTNPNAPSKMTSIHLNLSGAETLINPTKTPGPTTGLPTPVPTPRKTADPHATAPPWVIHIKVGGK